MNIELTPLLPADGPATLLPGTTGTEKCRNAILKLSPFIGNTQLYKFSYPHANLYTKLEHQNFFGSIKDRPALYILRKALEEGRINENTTVIESTSGNFGVALAGICQAMSIRFIAVVDPNLSAEKEQIMRLRGAEILRVTERDATGGYLLNRIKTVKAFLAANENAYQPDQYQNPDNYFSYYHTLGEEIVNSFSSLDYAFISVSTGGTITGLSQRLKEHYRNIRIIAVDVEGSMVFSNVPAVRKLSGLGASIRTPFFDKALIDDYIILSQQDIIKGCHELLTSHHLFLGASAGAAYTAADRILQQAAQPSANAVFISPDAGNAYIDTVYNQEWVNRNILTSQTI
ncbi:pyridoxal-phosphate dependent enzyme [Chitinophaga solisilvae]|uniref:Pyridoxal-phosphate dependent enzyme n=1 Tax=Chitinophaga solisilvae TaxID=1233460 RepID=A0A9Q5DFA3_9BACT|nr:pyridoxal-phosphate dependent enzyme [Chitinophaga solisilvae]NSL90990.1 pyridoxal-phosphate dependent enzyme [Chitinophaga solisilvae]